MEATEPRDEAVTTYDEPTTCPHCGGRLQVIYPTDVVERAMAADRAMTDALDRFQEALVACLEARTAVVGSALIANPDQLHEEETHA